MAGLGFIFYHYRNRTIENKAKRIAQLSLFQYSAFGFEILALTMSQKVFYVGKILGYMWLEQVTNLF